MERQFFIACVISAFMGLVIGVETIVSEIQHYKYVKNYQRAQR